jgi:hypothetical protein
VYSEEPVQYWRGRFSTLSDRLRSEDYSIQSANFASTATSTSGQPFLTPKTDKSDTFELDEIRRTCRAFDELHSCCRTPVALKSFHTFEREILAKLEAESAALQRGQSCTHSVDRKARASTAGSCSNVLGTDKDPTAATMKTVGREPNSKLSMTKSKTMWDMSQPTNALAHGANEKVAKIGSRRPSYLKARAEVVAAETTLSAERRAGAGTTSQKNVTSGVDIGGTTVATGSTVLGITPTPAVRQSIRHSLPRKSNGTGGGNGTGTNADVIKRVFSESVKSVRRMGRSFTGLNGAGEG